jgi:hypothetical protein
LGLKPSKGHFSNYTNENLGINRKNLVEEKSELWFYDKLRGVGENFT